MKKPFFYALLLALSTQLLFAKDSEKTESPKKLEEKVSITKSKVKIDDDWVKYEAHTGNEVIKKDDKDWGSFSYTAYFKTPKKSSSKRPITFVFNGGPGSSSVWLHIGMMGPKRVALNDTKPVKPPYRLINNDYSLLDITDLVFIDPMSTGYSKPGDKVEANIFYSTKTDVKSVGEFIRQFVTKHKRWSSPKFIAGESYGTTRSALLANHLQEEFGMYLNGVLLISSILDFSTVVQDNAANDLSYINYYPTFAATAHYHQPKGNQKNVWQVIKEAENFVHKQYAPALLEGSNLSRPKTNQLALSMNKTIHIDTKELVLSELRLRCEQFRNRLLLKQSKKVGRFDGRIATPPVMESSKIYLHDPSYTNLLGPFSSGMKSYLADTLKVSNLDDYTILANLPGWDFSLGKWSISGLNVLPQLKSAMIANPHLKVYVASGIYDMATPYFATRYTFNHMGLSNELLKNISIHEYDGGHMMYTNIAALKKMKAHIAQFYKKAL